VEVVLEVPYKVLYKVLYKAPSEVVVEIPYKALYKAPSEVALEIPYKAPLEAALETPLEAPLEVMALGMPLEVPVLGEVQPLLVGPEYLVLRRSLILLQCSPERFQRLLRDRQAHSPRLPEDLQLHRLARLIEDYGIPIAGLERYSLPQERRALTGLKERWRRSKHVPAET